MNEKKQLIVKSLEDLHEAARLILNDMGPQRMLAIHGKMGAGKTTFIKALCEVLGVQDVVSSPTFSLVNEYVTHTDQRIFHFDFYRVKKLSEVYDIGYEEYFYSGHYCFMEWPELILELLPESYVYLLIEEGDRNERLITYSLVGNEP